MTKYKDFCRKYHAEDKYYFSAYYVEAYVTYLSQNGLGLSSIQSTLSALRFHCRSNDIHITFDTARLALLLKGIKRTQIPKLRATNAVKLSHLTRLMSAASTIFDYKTGVLVRAMFSMAFFAVMCTLTSFMIHDSLGFSKIHVDSIQFNSFMTRFHKGFNSRFTKAGSSTELVQLTIQLTYDSLHQIQLNAIQQKTRFISDTC